jgi:hypothetical protein
MSVKHVEQFLTLEERLSVIEYATALPWFSDSWGRMTCNIRTDDVEHLLPLYNKGMDVVVDVFKVNNIAPTYFKFAKYSLRYGIPRVPPHIDENACTYTVDVQLDSTIDWSIYVELEEHVMSDGDALLYMGESQLHWRPQYAGQTNEDYITMLFMHYAHMDHWYFTKGPEFMADSDFHERWKQQMRQRLSNTHHEKMTDIDDGIL